MLSKIQICNMALLSIGTRSIASLDERTPEAAYCLREYDLALEEILREHRWNFAQSRKSLAGVPLPGEWAREYAQAFAYPSDCLHLHTLISETGRKSQEFAVAQHKGTPLVLTNLAKPVAAYTALITDTTRFDPLFARALAAKLACHLVRCITKSGINAVQAMEKSSQLALAKARTADAREGEPYAGAESEWNGGHDNPWIAARLGVYQK